MFNMKIRTALLPLFLLIALTATAQQQTTAPHWYAGAEGGMVFATSTLSSFGADKTRAGWSAGLFAGRRLSPALSLELAAGCGNATMSARNCCVESNSWLGSDGLRYNAAVLGMDGAPYSTIVSHVAMQRFGLRLNANLLGFFAATQTSRWTIDLTPSLWLYGTKASIERQSDGTTVASSSQRWHLGAGGRLQVGYGIASGVRLGLYSGIVWLTGQRMDGMPKHLHRQNFTWESGLRLELRLGRQTKKTATAAETAEKQGKEARP